MQLATSESGKLWSCNIHFYADNNTNLYWFSDAGREHSKHIEGNSEASVAIMVHEDNPEENYVIGIQMQGNAKSLSAEETELVRDAYFQKVGTPPALQADIVSGQRPLKLYKFEAKKIILFDTKNFPEDPRQVVK